MVENRAAGGTAIVLNPRPARSSRWPTSRRSIRTSIGESSEIGARNRAVQDLYEPGSTFKIVTASAAIEERVMPTDRAHRHQPRDPCASAIGTIDEFRGHNYGVLSFSDVIAQVEQRRRDRRSASGSAPSAWAATSIASDSGARLAGFPGREPGHRLESRQVDRGRARVRVDGLPGRRHAAADGGGGRARSPTAASTDRAAHRPGRVSRQPPIRRQAESPAPGRSNAATAATLTTIMEAVVDGWHRQAGADRRLHGCRQDGNRREADQRPVLGIREQRVVRRVCCPPGIRRSPSS